MKAVRIHQHGALEEVRLEEAEVPRPAPGEVLVRTRAAALNHLDLWVVGGLPALRLEMPHVLGSDGAGTVESLGEGVTAFSPGDRVMLNPVLGCGSCEFCLQGEESLCPNLRLVGEHCAGTFAEFFAVPAANLAAVPEQVSFQQAAAFSLVFQTAWRMLVTRAGLRPGEDVFIHGIGGGVSLAALQIARLVGARVFVSSSSQEKLTRAVEQGADFCFNYLEMDVVREVEKITSRRGVDVVIDNVGSETWRQSLRLARKGGRVVTCGATTGPNPETEIRLIFWKQLNVLGSTMSNRREHRDLVQLLGRGRLEPVIDRTYPLQEAREALLRLQEGRQFGKIVLVLTGG